MTVVVLLGAPGAGKGTQAPVLAARISACPCSPRATCSGPPSRRARALGREADRYMSRGQLVPDETIVRVLPRPARASPTRAGGAILDGFPRTRVQAEALDAALAEAGRRVDRAVFIDVPTEDLVRRMANRRICTANGHVYNLASNPPRVDGHLRPRRLAARPARRTTHEATVRARMAQQIPPLLEVVDHYRDAGVLQHGRRPRSRSTRSAAGAASTRRSTADRPRAA